MYLKGFLKALPFFLEFGAPGDLVAKLDIDLMEVFCFTPKMSYWHPHKPPPAFPVFTSWRLAELETGLSPRSPLPG